VYRLVSINGVVPEKTALTRAVHLRMVKEVVQAIDAA
jgi:hypothetical protein